MQVLLIDQDTHFFKDPKIGGGGCGGGRVGGTGQLPVSHLGLSFLGPMGPFDIMVPLDWDHRCHL